MKKILLLFMAVLTLGLTARAADGDKFTVDNLKYTVLSEADLQVGISGYETEPTGDLVIPSEVEYNSQLYSVSVIKDYAFRNCTGLTSVTFPDSLTEIGQFAFQNCRGLTSVTLPNSLTEIGGNAFLNCTGLKSVTFPDSLTEIGGEAFKSCTGLTSVTFPDSLTTIGYRAFYGCTGLTSVTFPDSLTEIGEQAFRDCTGLTSVTLPNSLTKTGEQAFLDCTGLKSVTFPNSLTAIETGAFSGCTGLTSVTFPNSLTEIGGNAFVGCTGLTSVTFPDSLTEIGDFAFQNCTGLTSVTFNSPNEDLVVYNAFSYCNFSTINFTGEYTIKAGAFNNIFNGSSSINTLRFYGNYVIGESAFENCNITYLYLYGKSDIGDKAFRNSNVASIYMADCEGVGEYAFASSEYPYKIFYLWCFNEEPPYVADVNAFSGLPTHGENTEYIYFKYAYIYIPYNSVDAYTKAYGWDYFDSSAWLGMGSLNDLTFTPSEVHLDLKKSTNISYDAVMTDGYEFTKTSWSSSDESVAVVGSSGTVQAKASGMAMIYFSYNNNYYLSSTVGATLVTVGDVDFSLTAEAEDSEIEVGETTTIVTTYGGQGYTVASETWSTSDAEVVTVDENGVVTGVADGEATITLKVTFDNGISVYRECAVSVAKGGGAGIESVDADSSAAPVEYFNLNGVRVNSNDLTPGLYIKCQGGKAEKVMVK